MAKFSMHFSAKKRKLVAFFLQKNVKNRGFLARERCARALCAHNARAQRTHARYARRRTKAQNTNYLHFNRNKAAPVSFVAS